MTPSTLLHPLKLDVVGFQEDEHDYHFRVELPDSMASDFDFDEPTDYGVPISTVMRLLESGDL